MTGCRSEETGQGPGSGGPRDSGSSVGPPGCSRRWCLYLSEDIIVPLPSCLLWSGPCRIQWDKIHRCWEKRSTSLTTSPVVLAHRGPGHLAGLGLKQSSKRCWANPEEGQAPTRAALPTRPLPGLSKVPQGAHADLCPEKGTQLWALPGRRRTPSLPSSRIQA